MPSFDVVSKIENHELSNAVDQANREISTRFDFKGVDAEFSIKDDAITMTAPTEFQIKQMREILSSKLIKRGIDVKSLHYKDVESKFGQAKRIAEAQQGIKTEIGKKIIKLIKNEKLKVQAIIQEDQVRVTGKKRDDLQSVITFLKDVDVDIPLQYINFRD